MIKMVRYFIYWVLPEKIKWYEDVDEKTFRSIEINIKGWFSK